MIRSVLAFTGETFYFDGGAYIAKQTSIKFLQETFGIENVSIAACLGEGMPSDCSSTVVPQMFFQMPAYSSTKDFVMRLLFRPNFGINFYRNARKVLCASKCDLVWIRSPSIGSLVFAVIALAHGHRIAHHMCANANNAWRSPKYSFLEKVFGLFVAVIIGRLVAYICSHPNTVNLTTGDELENISRRYSPDRTFQFVDMLSKPVEPNPLSIRNDETLKVLFVGRIVRDKGVFDLVDVVSQIPNASLLIVGDGPDFRDLKKNCEIFPVEKIELKGQLSHSKLDEIFNQVDVVCVPSDNYYEGFPRVIMEAWTHGRTVIVSDVGGVKAFVKDGVNGLIFNPGSKDGLRSAINALSDSNLRLHLEQGAREMKMVSTLNYWSAVVREIFYVA